MDIMRNYYAPMSLPWKLLRNRRAVSEGGTIYPVHIKLYPTDRCNACCPCCACRNLSRNAELDVGEMLDIVRHFHGLGTRAITLVGGGEPSLHSGLPQLFALCEKLDIQLGAITNGLLWSGRDGIVRANDHLVWARMTIVDTESGNYDMRRIARFSNNLPDVAVSMYFTVTKRMDLNTALTVADMAEDIGNCTHVKFVEDVAGGSSTRMDELEQALSGKYSKAILQRWEDSAPGVSNCLVSKLRPTVAADGYVYPCCSVPHVQPLDRLALTMPPEFRICRWSEFSSATPAFNGDSCIRCPWSGYNEVLAGLTNSLVHERFV